MAIDEAAELLDRIDAELLDRIDAERPGRVLLDGPTALSAADRDGERVPGGYRR